MKNKKESNWFPYDCIDAKEPGVIALKSVYKGAGFGHWILMLETLRLEEGYKYNLNTPCSYKVIASIMMITEAKAKKFINDLINEFQLLDTDGEYIWSPMLNEKMTFLEKRKIQFSKAGKKGAAVTNLIKKSSSTNDSTEDDEQVTRQNSAHNNTIHNNTEQNTTTTTIVVQEAAAENSLQVSIHANWEEHKTECLSCEKFMYHYLSSGLSNQQVGGWLDAFNRTLDFRNMAAKSNADYRIHFSNWLKFKNRSEDPANCEAAPHMGGSAPPPAIDPLAYLKTPAQIKADEDRHYEERKKKREQEKQKT
jgi:hypothetical protein